MPSHNVLPFVIASHVDCSRYVSIAGRRELRSGGGYVCVAKAFVSHFDSWIIREVPFFSSIYSCVNIKVISLLNGCIHVIMIIVV